MRLLSTLYWIGPLLNLQTEGAVISGAWKDWACALERCIFVPRLLCLLPGCHEVSCFHPPGLSTMLFCLEVSQLCTEPNESVLL